MQWHKNKIDHQIVKDNRRFVESVRLRQLRSLEPVRYGVFMKGTDDRVSVDLMTLEEFTAWAGAAARTYELREVA